MQKWMYDIRCKPHKDRAKLSSKTFKGIAKAMAKQWTEKIKMKKRMIALDADYLIFMCTEGKYVKNGAFGAEEGSTKAKDYKEPLKPYKNKFKRLVKEVEDEIATDMVGQVKGIKVILSDPNGKLQIRYVS